jgi:hypothetical protein
MGPNNTWSLIPYRVMVIVLCPLARALSHLALIGSTQYFPNGWAKNLLS